jgi:hypothetical protein
MRLTRAVAVLAGAILLVSTSPAMANHNHPSKANKFFATFVRAYQQCPDGTGTHNHNPPLSFGACTPVPASTLNSFGPKGSGQAIGVVKTNSLKQATDVLLIAKFSDIRNGDDGTGTPFSGNLSATSQIRTTDHFCDGGANNPCTMEDKPFPIGLPCTNGKCAAKTSANATVAAVVASGKQANIGLSQLQVYNGSDLVFEEGLYLP